MSDPKTDEPLERLRMGFGGSKYMYVLGRSSNRLSWVSLIFSSEEN